jgi:hypothetical protein
MADKLRGESVARLWYFVASIPLWSRATEAYNTKFGRESDLTDGFQLGQDLSNYSDIAKGMAVSIAKRRRPTA